MNIITKNIISQSPTDKFWVTHLNATIEVIILNDSMLEFFVGAPFGNQLTS